MANAVHAYFFPKTCDVTLDDSNVDMYKSFMLNESETFGNLAEAFSKYYSLSVRNFSFNLRGSDKELEPNKEISSIIEESTKSANIF
ncbi:hypothetical protein LPJ71_011204, partial [Coemansia sp. S17]